MGARRIILGRADADTIRAAARAAYPVECCGLLIGTYAAELVRVHAAVPVLNTALDPARHFEIDPQTLFDHMRSARESHMRIVGHYHSHPNGSATPSAEDLRMAHDRHAVWIVAAAGENPAGLRAFMPAGPAFAEIRLEEI